ncbi:MAG: PilC/PilY family type IV pilus protein [Hydrogenophaga sp.]|uniref:pilus assembly protein n=1 Tax=Hydrogenophaga sp. TaxID=1904254 RepID=UPI002ABBC384|nr:PilC/PilY family type IV pilus protein [Hydrogenophaga sp.]MDZ4279291.1 PilC/PilY family type IV pilus protein [Hydrogenophaga sp.]
MHKTRFVNDQRKTFVALLFSALTLSGAGMATAQVNIARTPLFLTSTADPNVMFILDDSGSMHWEVTPDDYVLPYFTFRRIAGLYGGGDYLNYVASVRYDATNLDERATARALRSFTVNKSYYDPSITYRPWVRADGTLYANASPTAAPHHPIRTGLGTRNLTVNNTESAIWLHRDTTGGAFCSISCTENSLTHYPAVYFRHNGGALWDGNNYTRVNIISTTATYSGDGRANRSDCTAGVCTYAQEIQNFANWYTYYRSRMLASQASIGRAFSTQPPEMRVGFGAINRGSTTVDNVATSTIIRGVRPFNGANRTNFYTELYEGVWAPASTPLRKALNDAGQYFSRADDRGPWGAVPGTDNTTAHLTCRQSYSILMTDGYWTEGEANQASTAGARENVDGTAGANVTGPGGQTYTYAPATPFTDAHSNTLADAAMYYWSRDLRPTLDNRVPTSEANPAFWQHMVTYGVGLGVTGSVNPSTAFGAIGASPPVTVTWPAPTSSNSAKLDDLLHAAVNSRGGFFSAADPETFATELSGVLQSIVARVAASGTAAATSSAVLQTDTLLYTASFRSTDWSGTVVAREVNRADGAAGAVRWNAEQILSARAPSNRQIFTSWEDGTTKVALDFSNLSPAQQAALNINPTGAAVTAATGANRVAWLRGTEHAGLRSRLVDTTYRRIGDLVSSDPQFMFKRDFGNSLLGGAEGSSYVTFRNSAAYRSRPDVLFVGSNGGMLHAFHAGTPFVNDPLASPPATMLHPDAGKELFAYVPSEVLLPGTSGTHAQINEFMRPDYSRRPYVDGSPAQADAYLGGVWKSVLVGSMGAGGRTVFALDVTDPENFDASSVMWEFKYANTPCVAHPTLGSTACNQIGFGVTKPKITRMRDGRWVVVFGNGYNSASHTAKLFVVDLQTGRLVHLLDTGVGSAGTPNGLAAVETTDWPASDLRVSRAYAGDLRGNLWRFDLTATPPSVSRLASATDALGSPQPITSRPSVALDPSNPSRIVILFGTGSFFRIGDDSIVSPQVQTMYGVYDAVTPVVNTVRADLRAQTITTNASAVTIGTVTYAAGTLRFVTDNAIVPTTDRGWRIDLPASGERVISEPTFPSGPVQTRVRFTTLIPSSDPCGSGRSGFVMDFNLLSGARTTTAVFDLSGDGVFNASDLVGGISVSGIGGTSGERLTVIRKADRSLDHMYGGDGNKVGDGAGAGGPVGRQSWRQLR